MNKVFFYSSDGTKLCGLWHLLKNPTKKAIILAHGITVDKDEGGIFIELAKLLCSDGFTVFRFDFRGHGESEGETVNMTIQGEVRDIEAAVKQVKEKGYTEIGLLGASFGGGITALYAANQQHNIKCLCMWNPVINYAHCFLNPVSDWLKGKGDHIKKDIETQGWTVLGRREVKYGKKLFDEMEHIYPYEEMKKITIPTAIIHGDADSHVPYQDSVDNVDSLSGVSELITIHGSEHGFHDRVKDQEKAINETLAFFKENL